MKPTNITNIAEATKNLYELRKENPGLVGVFLWDEPCVQLMDNTFREWFADFDVQAYISDETDDDGNCLIGYKLIRRFNGVRFFALSDHGKEGDDEVAEVES